MQTTETFKICVAKQVREDGKYIFDLQFDDHSEKNGLISKDATVEEFFDLLRSMKK